VLTYKEEFYRFNIRVGHIEEDPEKVARYINGLRYEIQDEIILLSLRTIEDAYQVAFKEKEKLSRKNKHRNKGRITTRGKGQSNRGIFKPSK
jgi:hypothetical protein